MSNRFSRSRSTDPFDPWFRVGTIDVNTTVLVTGLSVVSLVLAAVTQFAWVYAFLLSPTAVLSGQIWRVITFPLANGIDIWTVLGIFFFWYFGKELERDLGRFKMARLLVSWTLGLGLTAVAIAAVIGWRDIGLAGIGEIQTILILVFIAQHPHAQFFFGIPGWVIGAIIVALPILGAIAGGNLPRLLHILLGLAVCAIIARAFGLMSEYEFIPNFSGGPKRQRKPRAAKRRSGSGGAVTQGPWSAPVDPKKAAAQSRLDILLDKISAGGMASLSTKERDELMKLRDQLRGS
jgi:hypothetical protein